MTAHLAWPVGVQGVEGDKNQKHVAHSHAAAPLRRGTPGGRVRPISLLRLSLLRFVDSKFLGVPYGHANDNP